MLWTFVGFNVILVVLLVHFLKKVISAVKENYFVYPSEAEIDQVLPAEIMEHVMTFLDPNALLECRLVSKYWRHHAIKPRVEQCVLESSQQHMRSMHVPQLTKEIMNEGHGIFSGPDYPKRLLLRDRALAIKLGKQLLEVEYHQLVNVLREFQKDRTDVDKYIIKSIGYKARGDQCSISIGDYRELRFEESSVPNLDWNSIRYYESIDFMFDLQNYFDHYKSSAYTETAVYSVREVHPLKYFGFVPLSAEFLQVLAFIFLPLIIHDLLNSAFLSTLKLWFGPLIFIGTFVMNVIVVLDFKRGNDGNVLYKRAAIVLWTGLVVLSLVTYPYSSTYYAAMGMMVLTCIYVVLIYEYTFSWSSKLTLRRAAPALIALALVITANDWKHAVDSIRNGAILFRWFDNTVCYAILCINFIALNCFSRFGGSRHWKWSYLVDWDRPAVQMLIRSYAVVVFITLYAPTWKGNHV
eukprot:TRINITY_DN3859_c0_g1_i1.p1 TRINITY_DN3859_c0_g1~~TRINITY_DN3859_c0_g1_i1.p1  ORF type:complete len:466 (+),score=49.43 TRINITY_DN3859_c0_g1_i1:64-1461(+)